MTDPNPKTPSEVAVIPVEMTQRGVRLHSIDDAWRFCTAIEKSGVAPKGMSAAAIFAVVQAGAELGLTPFRALSNMSIINGRVGPMGALAKALVRAANVLAPGTGFTEKFTGTEYEDDFTASVSTRRSGESEARHTSFSVADAKLAMLWKKEGPWRNYPKRMLMWRAIGFHMDDYYSDVLMGMHISEVLQDYPGPTVTAVMPVLSTPSADPLLEALLEADEQAGKEFLQIAEELQAPKPAAEDPPSEPLPSDPRPEPPSRKKKQAPAVSDFQQMADHVMAGMDAGATDAEEANTDNAALEGEDPESPLIVTRTGLPDSLA